ncbi:transposase [Rhodophyticola sp. CCM32]|uniref:IS3 family transposase n=1 Tax=Rhodophyticola sp. CCM32 TaxID=2916397 RepID=UPI00107EFBAD|nr:IS3 family transposase [Rhodophyticola sp. CCM32]QBY01778.1 transposase [Rhodophyticola sp. CCM32]
MVEKDNPNLSIGKQCNLLSISRSSFYYQPKGETAMNLMLMRQIDEQFLETPFFGVRQMTWHLRNDGHLVNEKRIGRLMRLMGLPYFTTVADFSPLRTWPPSCFA